MKITDNRVVVINKLGEITEYPYEVGKQHQECIDDYATKNNYEYSNIDYVVSKNNVVFYCVNEELVVTYLPKTLSDEQLELLDRLSLKMNDIAYMEVRKAKEKGHQDFILVDNIGRRFSDEVIQSYFESDKNKSM